MDVIIGYKYINLLSELDIDISKKLDGEYDVDELIEMFKNFFFNKMFLDITSIKDYKNTDNLQKLSMYVDIDKVIILLDKEDIISKSNEFLSKLVNMGIYNFTDDSNNLMYLYNNPNSYRDVAFYQKSNQVDLNKSINNNLTNIEEFSNKDKVIGIKNVTQSAGSTTFTYLLKKYLSKFYNVIALEVNSNEFIYFKEDAMFSVKDYEIRSTLNNYNNADYILVDLSKSTVDDFCSTILYLVEPSTIKLNKLMLVNPQIFSKFKDKKIILNKSLLNKKDISTFEMETGLKVYYNVPPINDKEDCSNIILPLLEKLNLIKEDNSVNSDSNENNFGNYLLNIFKRK